MTFQVLHTGSTPVGMTRQPGGLPSKAGKLTSPAVEHDNYQNDSFQKGETYWTMLYVIITLAYGKEVNPSEETVKFPLAYTKNKPIRLSKMIR